LNPSRSAPNAYQELYDHHDTTIMSTPQQQAPAENAAAMQRTQQRQQEVDVNEDPLLIAQTLTYVTDDGSVLASFQSAPASWGKKKCRIGIPRRNSTDFYEKFSSMLTIVSPSHSRLQTPLYNLGNNLCSTSGRCRPYWCTWNCRFRIYWQSFWCRLVLVQSSSQCRCDYRRRSSVLDWQH
jgi:hypothetical protein